MVANITKMDPAVERKTVLPRKVPMKKTPKGTLMTGEVMLMNQLGRKGVILKKMM